MSGFERGEYRILFPPRAIGARTPLSRVVGLRGWLNRLEVQLVMWEGHGTSRLVAFLEDARAQSAPVFL